MGYTYLKLLTHTFRIIKMDHIFSYVSKKQGKTFILIYTHRKWLHGINLLIVNDFIITHERKSSDEQLRKEIESSRSAFVSPGVFILLVRSTLLLSLYYMIMMMMTYGCFCHHHHRRRHHPVGNEFIHAGNTNRLLAYFYLYTKLYLTSTIKLILSHVLLFYYMIDKTFFYKKKKASCHK